jgi:predicted nucleotidyltransferase
MICCKYSADPNGEAAMVTGSVSLGQVDAVSDVDMMLYYRELPSAEMFESIKGDGASFLRYYI